MIAVGDHVLRPFRREDASAWCAYLQDPHVTEHTSWPSITAELIADLVERNIADYAEMKSLRWALARRDDNKLIGMCGYIHWSREMGTAEIAYDLSPAYWGRGLMSAAVNAAVAWAFDAGSLGRIEALVMTTNLPSIAVADRTGFRLDQTLPAHRTVRGVPRDYYRYVIESPR